MLFALGAVSNALDFIQSLTSSKSSATQQTGSSPGAANPFAIDSSNSTSGGAAAPVNSGNGAQISPETMSALIAAQSQSADATGSATSTSSTSRDAALKDLFSQIDANGDGQISKSEFESALGAGGTNLAQADDVFSKLDSNSDGSVSLDEMSKALKGSGHSGGHHHAHAAHGAGGAGDASGSGSDSSSSQSSGGSTSTSSTNSDGSTTTTVTYADGFKISTTVPGASNAQSSPNSPYNWFEQMMQRQTQAASGSAASSMSMSV